MDDLLDLATALPQIKREHLTSSDAAKEVKVQLKQCHIRICRPLLRDSGRGVERRRVVRADVPLPAAGQVPRAEAHGRRAGGGWSNAQHGMYADVYSM